MSSQPVSRLQIITGLEQILNHATLEAAAKEKGTNG